jgi:hypothetical protein
MSRQAVTVIGEEAFLALNGAGRSNMGDPSLHRPDSAYIEMYEQELPGISP